MHPDNLLLNLSDKIEEVKKSCFSKSYHLLSVEKYEKPILNNRFEISALHPSEWGHSKTEL